MSIPANEILPNDAAATYIGMSASFLNKTRIRGDGPTHLKVGKKVLYRRSDLDAWLDRCRRTSTSQAAS